ncbi:MAG: hypothetical protein U9N86_03590, partial [Bacteroidota bacterium]|nr:hypothetical protein [Bacteroidota bacterium]
NEIGDLKFSLQANEDSPVSNPAFVIKNWGDNDVSLKVNGKKVFPGKGFRTGHIRRINQYDLVIWLEIESNSKISFSLAHK